MNTVKVHLGKNSYDIVIGNSILSKLGAFLKKRAIGTDAIVITNHCVHTLHGKSLVAGLKRSGFSVKVIEVPDTEKSKSTAVAVRLLESIARYDVRRKVFIIAFGGGVIGDLAGFIAAVYKRGVPYVQVPTTLLAQIDSAIGGKTAVDLAIGKNLVGAFYQPQVVWSDVSVLKTLTQRQIKNGLSEAVKYGVIADKKLFVDIQKKYRKLLSAHAGALRAVVRRCSAIKAAVVARDEKEIKGIRTILNFGHTVGHAIEAAGGYSRYHHGEAVALGMRVAAMISYALGLCRQDDCLLLEGVLTDIGLPARIQRMPLGKILRIMEHDKKFKAGKNRFVLMRAIGRVCVVEDISPVVIKQAVQCLRAAYT